MGSSLLPLSGSSSLPLPTPVALPSCSSPRLRFSAMARRNFGDCSRGAGGLLVPAQRSDGTRCSAGGA
eukprot:9228090-Alexandrium_andersonii.AAC.1